MATKRAPAGLGTRGRWLWRSILERMAVEGIAFDAQEELLLVEACRVADRLDDLDVQIRENAKLRQAGLLMTVDGKADPLLAESRLQQITMTRLIASLRLPDEDAATAGRPQRRGAARGVYQGGGDEE